MSLNQVFSTPYRSEIELVRLKPKLYLDQEPSFLGAEVRSRSAPCTDSFGSSKTPGRAVDYHLAGECLHLLQALGHFSGRAEEGRKGLADATRMLLLLTAQLTLRIASHASNRAEGKRSLLFFFRLAMCVNQAKRDAQKSHRAG